MCIKKFMGHKNKTSAKVVEGKLILSCPGAEIPVVWQMDLNEAKACAFEVQCDEKANGFLAGGARRCTIPFGLANG